MFERRKMRGHLCRQSEPPEPPRPEVGPLDMTVVELLEHWATLRPHHPAIVFRHPSQHTVCAQLTYEDLFMLGTRFSAVLRSRGVKRGDVVVVLLPNSPERAVVEAALILLQAFSVSVKVEDDNIDEVVRTVRTLRASCVVLDPGLTSRAWDLLREECQLYDRRTGTVSSVRMPHLFVLLPVKRNTLKDENDFMHYLRFVCTCSRHGSTTNAPYPHHPCALLASRGWRVGGTGRGASDDILCCGEAESGSGSGGTPNAPGGLVLHSHKNMVAFSKLFMPKTLEPLQSCFNNYPFTSVRGHLSVSLCNPVTRIMLDEHDGPPESLAASLFQAIHLDKLMMAVVPPAAVTPLRNLYQEVIDRDEDPHCLAVVGFIGEEMTEKQLKASLTFGRVAFVTYVSTEMLLMSATMMTSPRDVDWQDGTVGCPCQPGVLVKVVDNEGKELPRNQVGHLLIRSPMMFMCHLKNKKNKKRSLDWEGYLRTGDMGRVRNGRLFVTHKTSDPLPPFRTPSIYDMYNKPKES